MNKDQIEQLAEEAAKSILEMTDSGIQGESLEWEVTKKIMEVIIEVQKNE